MANMTKDGSALLAAIHRRYEKAPSGPYFLQDGVLCNMQGPVDTTDDFFLTVLDDIDTLLALVNGEYDSSDAHARFVFRVKYAISTAATRLDEARCLTESDDQHDALNAVEDALDEVSCTVDDYGDE